MGLGSIIVGLVSAGYQAYQRKKQEQKIKDQQRRARERARAQAQANNAVDIRSTNSNSPVNLAYGYTGVEGIQVFTDSRDGWNLTPAKMSGNITKHLSGLKTETGGRRQVLAKQDVLTVGEIDSVTFAVIDDEPMDSEKFYDEADSDNSPNAWGNFYQPASYTSDDPTVDVAIDSYSSTDIGAASAQIYAAEWNSSDSAPRTFRAVGQGAMSERYVCSRTRIDKNEYRDVYCTRTVEDFQHRAAGYNFGSENRTRRYTHRTIFEHKGTWYFTNNDDMWQLNSAGTGATRIDSNIGQSFRSATSDGNVVWLCHHNRLYYWTPSAAAATFEIGLSGLSGSVQIEYWDNKLFILSGNKKIYRVHYSGTTVTRVEFLGSHDMGGTDNYFAYVDGTRNKIVIGRNDRRSYTLDFPTSAAASARFTGIASASWGFFLNLDDPAYSGPPFVSYFMRGKRVGQMTVTGYDTSIALSNNSVRVLLDFMTDNDGNYGPLVQDDEFNTESFLQAQNYGERWFGNAGASALRSDTYPNARNAIAGTTYSNYAAYITAATDISSTKPSGLTFEDWERHANAEATEAALQRTLGADMLKLWSFNGILSTSRNFFEAVSSILDTMPGAIMFRSTDGKYQLSFVDVTQAVQTQEVIDNFSMIGALSVTYPETSDRVNRITINYVNIEKDYAADVLEFPTPNSVLDRQLQDKDGLVLRSSETLAGVNNRYHATMLAVNSILISRRETYEFTTSHRNFLLEVGDVIQLTDTNLNINVYVRILRKRLNPDFTITWNAIRFSRWDYDLYLTDSERIPLEAENPGRRTQRTLGVTISGDSTINNSTRKTYTATVTGTATGTISYTWTLNGEATIISGQGTNRLVVESDNTNEDGGAFVLDLLVERGGLSSVNTFSVTIIPTAAPTVIPRITGATSVNESAQNVRFGSVVTGTATGAITRAWSISGDASIDGSTSGTNVTVDVDTLTGNANGQFELTLEATRQGITATDTHTVTVVNNITATIQASITGANSIDEGASAETYTVDTAGTTATGLGYLWTLSNANATIPANSTGTSVDVTPAVNVPADRTTELRCRVTGNSATTVTARKTITIKNLIQITVSISGAGRINEGATSTFTASVSRPVADNEQIIWDITGDASIPNNSTGASVVVTADTLSSGNGAATLTAQLENTTNNTLVAQDQVSIIIVDMQTVQQTLSASITGVATMAENTDQKFTAGTGGTATATGYAWTLGDGADAAIKSGASTSEVTITSSEVDATGGEFDLNLAVTGSDNTSATATKNVKVTNVVGPVTPAGQRRSASDEAFGNYRAIEFLVTNWLLGWSSAGGTALGWYNTTTNSELNSRGSTATGKTIVGASRASFSDVWEGYSDGTIRRTNPWSNRVNSTITPHADRFQALNAFTTHSATYMYGITGRTVKCVRASDQVEFTPRSFTLSTENTGAISAKFFANEIYVLDSNGTVYCYDAAGGDSHGDEITAKTYSIEAETVNNVVQPPLSLGVNFNGQIHYVCHANKTKAYDAPTTDGLIGGASETESLYAEISGVTEIRQGDTVEYEIVTMDGFGDGTIYYSWASDNNQYGEIQGSRTGRTVSVRGLESPNSFRLQCIVSQGLLSYTAEMHVEVIAPTSAGQSGETVTWNEIDTMGEGETETVSISAPDGSIESVEWELSGYADIAAYDENTIDITARPVLSDGGSAILRAVVETYLTTYHLVQYITVTHTSTIFLTAPVVTATRADEVDTIEWTSVTGAQGYEITWSGEAQSSWLDIGDVNSYVKTGADNTVVYRVRAYNAEAESNAGASNQLP